MKRKLLLAALLTGATFAGAFYIAGKVEAQGFIFPSGSTFFGHTIVSGGTPVLTACGTTPAIVGTDRDGQVTMGTTATGCVITFSIAYTQAPLCVINWQATPLASQSWTLTNAAITTVQTSASNNKLNYHCEAQPGG